MQDRPSLRQVASVLRDQAFDDIREVSGLAASYSRSIDEAAFRGDGPTVFTHLKQLRLCIVAMIRTYKDYLEGGDGQGVSETNGPSEPNRQDQRPGDAMAHGELE